MGAAELVCQTHAEACIGAAVAAPAAVRLAHQRLHGLARRAVAIGAVVVGDEELGAAGGVEPDSFAVGAPRAALHACTAPRELTAEGDLSERVCGASMAAPVCRFADDGDGAILSPAVHAFAGSGLMASLSESRAADQ